MDPTKSVYVVGIILKLLCTSYLPADDILIFLHFSFMKYTNWRLLCAQVWNLGPSTVERAEIEFQIPHQYVLPPVQEIFMRILEPQVSGLSGILKDNVVV